MNSSYASRLLNQVKDKESFRVLLGVRMLEGRILDKELLQLVQKKLEEGK